MFQARNTETGEICTIYDVKITNHISQIYFLIWKDNHWDIDIASNYSPL